MTKMSVTLKTMNCSCKISRTTKSSALMSICMLTKRKTMKVTGKILMKLFQRMNFVKTKKKLKRRKSDLKYIQEVN